MITITYSTMRGTILFIALASSIFAFGQTEKKDSIEAKELNEVIVEAQMQRTGASTSTYIPN